MDTESKSIIKDIVNKLHVSLQFRKIVKEYTSMSTVTYCKSIITIKNKYV